MSGFKTHRRVHRAAGRASRFLLVPSTVALLVAGVYAPDAPAATIDYASTSDGNLATASNWQGGATPTGTDTASIGQGAPIALTLQNTNLSVQNLVYTATSPSTTLTLSTTGPGSTSLNLGGISNLSDQLQTISVASASSTLNLTGGSVTGNVKIAVDGVFANVNVTSGADSGTATILISNGATATFDASKASASSLTTSSLTGASSLYFTNGSSAAGSSITNNAGSVLGFNDTSSAGSARISNLGSATFAGTSTGAHSIIANMGTLTIANAASLATAAVNNAGDTEFTGTATAAQSAIMNTGTLTFHDQTSSGAASIDNAAKLSFADQSNAGSATITNQPSGVVTFSGSSDASSAHIANQGSIDASGMAQTLAIGSLNGSGMLLVGAQGVSLGALSGSDSVTGVISGSGGLTKIGSGQLFLGAANSYSGATVVSSGTLDLSGSIVSAITVNALATLTGVGTADSDVHVAAAGVIAPGAAGSIFHVGGNLTLAPQSIFAPDVAANGTSSRIDVAGTANIGGSLLHVNAGGAATSYAPGTSYTILSAQQGVSGNFATVASNLALLAPHVSYYADDVTLSFTQLQATGGGSGSGINGMTNGGSGQAGAFGSGALIPALDGLSGAALSGALADLGAASFGALRQVELIDADNFARKVMEHQFAAATSAENDISGGWLELQAAHTSLGAATRSNQSGVIGGATLYRNENSVVSVDAQILHAAYNLGADNASSDRFDLGLSALRNYQYWSLQGALSYGQHHDEVDRFIAIGNYVQGPSSHANGDNFSGYVEAGTTLQFEDVDIAPYVATQWTMTNDGGFEESNGNATDLLGRARRENLISNALKVRLRSHAFELPTLLGAGGTSTWSANVAWIHQDGCLDGRVDASFLADPGHDIFMSTASPLGHDRGVASVAANTSWRSGWHLQVRVAGEAGGAMHGVGGFAGAGYDFN